jgi:hypothetical protein
MGIASGGQHALDFGDYSTWILYVFEDGVALDPLKEVAPEGKLLRGGCDGDAREREEVHVHVTVDEAACASDIEIPAPERRIDSQLGRVWEAEVRGFEKPENSLLPAHGMTAAVQICYIFRTHIGRKNYQGSTPPWTGILETKGLPS